MNSNIIKKYCSKSKKINILKNAIIYEDQNGKKYVIKENTNDVAETFNYLRSRDFKYIPNVIYYDRNIYKYEYLDSVDTPFVQKIYDIIKLDSLLHSKTAYYIGVSLDEIKELYESINMNIDDTFKYYDDIITSIENNIYMSPGEYLLVRNCSMIFTSLNICKERLDKWYEILKRKRKKRVVLLHNNLCEEHLIKSSNNTLISWNKSKMGIPVFDILNIYKLNYNMVDFKEIYNIYVKIFPLFDEEKELLFTLLLLPKKIDYNLSEIQFTKDITKLYNYLSSSYKLFMEENNKENKKQDNDVNEK